MKDKFISEAEMCKRDSWLPEALMCVAYFQDVKEERLAKSMKIDIAHAAKLVELLEEYGFVKTEEGKKKLTFTQQEYLEKYNYSIQDMESLFGIPMPKLDEKLIEKDSLLPEALQFAAERGAISITSLRRRFAIGYPRAARIFDIMEEEGFISPPSDKYERTVYVKKEDFGNMSRFSGKKTQKRADFFTENQKKMIEEHKKDFNLDSLKLLDENGETLNANKSKHIKDILIEQFCGIGIICIECQDAEVFFKKNNNIMHCKTFDKPSKEELQTFVDKNKIDAAIILYEVNPNTEIMEIQPLIPKANLLYFAIATPLPTIKQIKVNMLY